MHTLYTSKIKLVLMSWQKDPKKHQELFWYPKYFLMKINSSPTTRKLCICQYGIINNNVSAKVHGNQTMLSFELLTQCCHSSNGSKRNIFTKHPTCSRNRNNHMFSLPGYAGIKLFAYAGWVLPTGKEGYSQVMLSSLLKSNVVKYTFFR